MSNQEHKKDEMRAKIMALLEERLYEEANAKKIQYHYRMYRCKVKYRKLVFCILQERVRNVSASKIIYAYRKYQKRHKNNDEQNNDNNSQISWSMESRVVKEHQRGCSSRAGSDRADSARTKSARAKSARAKSARTKSAQADSARCKSPIENLVDCLSSMSF